MKRACETDVPCEELEALEDCGAATQKLNVGGACFEVSNDTLSKIEYFQPLLSGRFRMNCTSARPIFIDRCGQMFQHVLQYARTGQRPSRRIIEESGAALLAECEFFGFQSLANHLRDETSSWDFR